MRLAVRVALALAGALVLVGVGTYLAGERVEVAVLRTFDADGGAHETKLWIVDHDGRPWVRVARPQRAWYQRLLANPRVELLRGGAPAQPMRATPDPSPQARAALDAAFAARYGRTDGWYGVLLRRDPIPVRLDPEPAAGPPRPGAP